jgi:hypothetical protein
LAKIKELTWTYLVIIHLPLLDDNSAGLHKDQRGLVLCFRQRIFIRCEHKVNSKLARRWCAGASPCLEQVDNYNFYYKLQDGAVLLVSALTDLAFAWSPGLRAEGELNRLVESV